MVAERRVELHSGIEQRLVWAFELGDEVGGALATVQVVAEHDGEVERELLPRLHHLLGHLVLLVFACAVVAHGHEFHRVGLVRQGDMETPLRRQ